jgi:hypothetical protein
MAVFLTSVMAVLIDEKPPFDHDRGRDIIAWRIP